MPARSPDSRNGDTAPVAVIDDEDIAASPGLSIDNDYQRMVESCPDIIYRLRIRPSPRIEYINPACERVWGYTPEEVMGQGLEFLRSILVDERERIEIEDVAAGRRFYPTVVRRYRRKDGTAMWGEVHSIPLYDDTGALVAQVGTIRDVSDRERSTIELQVAVDRLRQTAQWLPDLVVRLDDSGLITEHIPTGSRQPPQKFVGRRLVDTVTDEFRSLATRAFERAQAGTPTAFRAIVRLGNLERTYEFRITPTGQGDFGLILRDVTGESVTLTDEQRQLAHERSDVVAGSGIEYRNPYRLTFREFAVLALVARGATDKEIARDLGIALSTVNNHVSNLLRKMGAASRTEAGVRAVQEGIVSFTVPGGRPTR